MRSLPMLDLCQWNGSVHPVSMLVRSVDVVTNTRIDGLKRFKFRENEIGTDHLVRLNYLGSVAGALKTLPTRSTCIAQHVRNIVDIDRAGAINIETKVGPLHAPATPPWAEGRACGWGQVAVEKFECQ